jgi:hypothetical protein
MTIKKPEDIVIDGATWDQLKYKANLLNTNLRIQCRQHGAMECYYDGRQLYCPTCLNDMLFRWIVDKDRPIETEGDQDQYVVITPTAKRLLEFFDFETKKEWRMA